MNQYVEYFLVGLLVVLIVFVAYVYLECLEENNGTKQFSTQKCGILLKRIFGFCFPDMVLIFIANSCIACGEIGSSCLDLVQADAEIREKKKAARIATSLAKFSKKKKKSKSKKSDFEALADSEGSDIEGGGSAHDNEVMESHDDRSPSPFTNSNPIQNPHPHREVRNGSSGHGGSNHGTIPRTPSRQKLHNEDPTYSPNTTNYPSHKEPSLPLPSISFTSTNSGNRKDNRMDLSNSSHGKSILPGLSGRDLKELIDTEDKVLGTSRTRV